MPRVLIAVAVALTGIGALVLAGMATGQSGGTDRELFSHLRGTNEVGADGRRAGGDSNAFGTTSITMDVAGGQLCFGMTVRGTDTVVAAHIHRGTRRQNGDVVVPLGSAEPQAGALPQSGSRGAAGTCVPAQAAVLRAIRRNPNRFYVNVHTTAHPGGAMRGQLFRAPRR